VCLCVYVEYNVGPFFFCTRYMIVELKVRDHPLQARLFFGERDAPL